MMNGNRDKWTRILANFEEISAMNIACDKSHRRAPWGFAVDSEGRQVWATALESQYPKKMCLVLTSIVLEVAAGRGFQLQASQLSTDQNPLASAVQAQMSSDLQPKPSKIPPIVAIFKMFPTNSRLLRVSANPELSKGGVVEAQVQEGDSNKKRKVDKCHPLEVAFGSPWMWETFVDKAVHSQHPFVRGTGVPLELQEAINKHVEWNDEQLCKYRLDWCKKRLIRAKQLDQMKKESNSSRPPHVAEVTKGKRVLLTREILEELGYDDLGVLSLLEEGKKATVFGSICKALGVQFNFHRSKDFLMHVENTEARKKEICGVVGAALEIGRLGKAESLILRNVFEVESGGTPNGRLVLEKLHALCLESGFPAFLDAARQQTELVFWIVRTVQEHEGKLQSLSRQLADQLSVTKLLSEERCLSARFPCCLDAGVSVPRAHGWIFFSGPKDLSIIKVAELASWLGKSRAELYCSCQRKYAESPPARRFSFIEGCLNSNIKLCWFCCFATGGRRPSTRSLPLQVDPGFAGAVCRQIGGATSAVKLPSRPKFRLTLQQASEELNELADGLSKRVKLVEETVSELKVQSIEELEVRLRGSAADEVTAEDLAEHPEVQPVDIVSSALTIADGPKFSLRGAHHPARGAMKRGALLLLTVPVAAIVSRRQASNSSRPSLDSCSCNCCFAAERSQGLTCVPGDNCRLCAPGALQSSFAALYNEVDYSRYCFAKCQPGSQEQCVERETLHKDTHLRLLREEGDNVAAPAAAPASADLSEVKHTGEVAAESLAEVALMQAKRHAHEAKQSAALARFAYEKLAKSREAAAEAAGQAVLEDVIIDARKDAGEAVKIRAGWEDEARAHAAQKAVAAAAVYKKAKLRDLQVAEAWEHQATLLLKTSRQYEEYASRQEMKEKKVKAALKKLTEKEEKEIPALVQEASSWTGFAPAPAFAAWQGVAQAPVAAVAPPPASAGGALTIGEVSPPMAQAPVAAVAPSPTSAEMASKELQPVPKVADAVHAASAVDAASAKDAKDVKVVPLASSPAAAPTASAVEKTEEKAKEKSEETAKKESKKETQEKEKSEETAKKESKKETEEKEKSEETAKKENKKETEEKTKSEETAKKESKKDTEEGAKAKTTKPVAPAPAPAPSVATAIFGGEPLTSPKDEKARLLQDLQTVQAQVDAGLELAHKYELQAFAARKEAQGIRANASWYDGAEQAAAAHTLYAELPKGVIPPPSPHCYMPLCLLLNQGSADADLCPGGKPSLYSVASGSE
eukprot:symbB.v1.2.011465.t1/scaffold770.1/size163962/1